MHQNKNCAYLHFVWATYDRLPLISEDMERELYRYISQVCLDDRCDILAVGGVNNHVHLLVRMSLTVSCSDLMKHVKGGSSRFISAVLKPGEWFAWQGSYGVFSVAIRDREKVIRYIQNQKRHHEEGSVWPEAEASSESVASGHPDPKD